MKRQGILAISLFLPCLLFISCNSEFPSGPEQVRLKSCGSLPIRYPFRLRGDPSFCGDANYELVCKENMTLLNLHSVKFTVTEISYKHSRIRIVDEGVVNGNCGLPYRSLSPESFSNLLIAGYFIDHRINDLGWAAFLNCSSLVNDSMYHPLPCLSSENLHVYAMFDKKPFFLYQLKPSCHFVAMTPVSMEYLKTESEIMKVIKTGFEMQWIKRDYHPNHTTEAQIIGACWNNATSLFFQHIKERQFFSGKYSVVEPEMEFFKCLDGSKIGHRRALSLAVVLGIVHLSIVLLVVRILLGRLVFGPLCIFVLLVNKNRAMRSLDDGVEKFLRNQQSQSVRRFTYSNILTMTNNFKEKLGQGGFGSVFKGRLPGGYLVAVKMLRNSKCNGEEFISEVSTTGRIHHINVLQLIGFCSEGTTSALVYEYMPNGSLDKYIFSANGSNRRFTSEELCDIALGAARGIEYLHQGCDMCILHFDIKPHNILLDHNFKPRISDFGLARLYPKSYSFVSVSAARGTIGYIAPELISRNFGVISCKSDVYSFGMLLFEMAVGRRNVNLDTQNSSEIYFSTWIYDRLLSPVQVPFTVDDYELDDIQRKLCMVGLWCIQMKSSDRPSMSEVIKMLEGSTDSLQMPPKPFFNSSRGITSAAEIFSHSSTGVLSIISEQE